MNNSGKLHYGPLRSSSRLLVLALLSLALPLMAGSPKSEEQLLKDLASPNPGKVTSALQQLEKAYPNSPSSTPQIKKLLADPRSPVRRKAARVLGVVHAELSDAELKSIYAMLKAPDREEIIDGLKSIRGLKAPGAVAEVLPLLKHSHPNVIRDACRTLAIFGTKENIPAIEPLLAHPVPAVKKDAEDAIFQLRNRP